MTVDYMMQSMCENNFDGNVAIFTLIIENYVCS
jgi:hypothetical protein